LNGFLAVYTDLAEQQIYLGGVDYAGKFVPNVAFAMLENGWDEQLAGILVMDGLVDTIT
jgi:hypothetical protein